MLIPRTNMARIDAAKRVDVARLGPRLRHRCAQFHLVLSLVAIAAENLQVGNLASPPRFAVIQMVNLQRPGRAAPVADAAG